MHGRNRDFAPSGTMRFQERRDIDVRHAVAVGEEEFAVGRLQVLRRLKDAPPRAGLKASTRKRNLPVTFRHLLVELDLRRMAERDRGIACAEVVVHEVIHKRLALVAETEDEALAAERRIALHDMPENRLLADRHHRLRQQLRHVAQTRPLATAEDHHGRHRPGNLLVCRFHRSIV